ncbi:beta-ketoacyl-ACP synthase III [Psychrobium sp. 1_MG-2023]|nr:beta-ketoacyl-ACP synthase III [Psychrobium sp. 1_MG-2023]MDP2559958.1 beta-ketoacyl-ACP synthase III [Psychrobium sp. 1_MG-2023]PKF56376.1 beta-ketoacyl-ACP synthase III [Alteromonadales bacterium alter-6D02]
MEQGMSIVISGTGLYTPPYTISNDELVSAFNEYVAKYNSEHAKAIAQGEIEGLKPSSSEFITKASGIENRYVMSKDGILDTDVMMPLIAERDNEQVSIQTEMAVAAAREAMASANKTSDDIDLIIVACSYTQRAYPAIAIEVQQQLGCKGWAYDMLVACSSATFGIMNASNALLGNTAKTVLVISPEIASPQINYRDRDSHFIFGDVATAVVVEKQETATAQHCFKILSQQPMTSFSNNIRSNFGHLNRCNPETADSSDKLFVQQGRKVFKEVLPMVYALIDQEMAKNNLQASDLKRLFLHQANINMNTFVAKKVLGRNPQGNEAPIILNEFANTASAGSIIAFHRHHDDMVSGDKAIICSFGAGYSAGCLVIEHL